MTSPRLFTVGVPVVIYEPVDDRQLVSPRAAHARLLEYHRQHPARVAALIRRVPRPAQPLRIFAPDGMLVTRHTSPNGARLHARLRKLIRDCERSGLVLSVPSWIAHVEVRVLAQPGRGSADNT